MNDEYIINYLSCAERVLDESHITKYFYNLFGYSDDKVCLDYDPANATWEIYYGFRDEKEDLQSFDNPHDAISELFERLAGSKQMKEKLEWKFKRYVRQSMRSIQKKAYLETVSAAQYLGLERQITEHGEQWVYCPISDDTQNHNFYAREDDGECGVEDQ